MVNINKRGVVHFSNVKMKFLLSVVGYTLRDGKRNYQVGTEYIFNKFKKKIEF